MKDHSLFEINYKQLLQELQFSDQQFTDMCIMFGTDYNKNIYRIGCEKAYKLIEKYKNIETIENNGFNVTILNYKKTRELFTLNKLNYIQTFDFTWNEPNWEFLKEFLKFKNVNINILKILWMKKLTIENL